MFFNYFRTMAYRRRHGNNPYIKSAVRLAKKEIKEEMEEKETRLLSFKLVTMFPNDKETVESAIRMRENNLYKKT